MNYDQLGRVLTREIIVAPAGQSMPADPVLASNSYDQSKSGYYNIGQLTTSQNGVAQQKLDYGASGQVLRRESVIDGVNHITSITESSVENPIAVQYTPGPLDVGTATAPWTYNGEALLASIPGYISAIDYEADNQTREITYTNGVTTTFAYSPTRRWLTRVTTVKGATILMDNQYTRDLAGRIIGITGLTPTENWTYTYDNADRLLSASNAGNAAISETFSYAANDNLLTRSRVAGTYIYPAATSPRPHAPVTVGTKALTYDANGNMTADGTRALTWDAANRLQSVTMAASTSSYAYGPDGARAKKTFLTGSTLYPDADVEIDAAVAGAEVFTRYPHPDIKVVNGAKYFLHRNHLASVHLVTDATGNLV